MFTQQTRPTPIHLLFFPDDSMTKLSAKKKEGLSSRAHRIIRERASGKKAFQRLLVVSDDQMFTIGQNGTPQQTRLVLNHVQQFAQFQIPVVYLHFLEFLASRGKDIIDAILRHADNIG